MKLSEAIAITERCARLYDGIEPVQDTEVIEFCDWPMAAAYMLPRFRALRAVLNNPRSEVAACSDPDVTPFMARCLGHMADYLQDAYAE